MSICDSILNLAPPIFILLVVIWSYHSYVVAFCIFYIKDNVTKRITYLVVYHIFLIMFLWSFFACMLQSHAPIPQEYRLLPEEHKKLVSFKEEDINLVLKKLIDLRDLEIFTCTDKRTVRYCRHCLLLKPDRTHHCSTCQRCILKMDHHCPWVKNCVGYSNYKQFILTLLYACMLDLFYCVTLIEVAIVFVKTIEEEIVHLNLFIGFLSILVAFISVLVLLVYHIRLIYDNETTLESLRELTFIDNRYNSFDLGTCNNFLEIFGNNFCLWLLPIGTSLGNGYEFEVT